MKALHKKLLITLKAKRLTLCEVLNDLGYISDIELYLEGEYNKANVKPWHCGIYRVIIMPFALLLRKYPDLFAKFANWGVRYFWLDKALKEIVNTNVRLRKK